MLKPLRLGVAAAMVGAIVTCGSGVFAWDYHRPGISCRAVSGNISYTGGNAANLSGQTDLTVQCPMHRRNTESDLPIEQMYVRVDDEAFYETIECYARSCDRYGASCDNSLVKESPGGQGKTTLSLFSADADPEGFVYLNCFVPDMDEQDGGNSAILSYRWQD